MISVTEAQQVITGKVHPLPAETVSLAAIWGRVLREAVVSPEDLPAFDRSAMDGYAIRLDEKAETCAVVGEIRAGQAIDLALEPGQAVRILTGARLPGPGLRVVPQEQVEVLDGRIRILLRSSVTHVRLRGEDARAGETLLPAGHVIDASAAALLATLGKVSVSVSRMPRVLHLTTGDEIVPPEQTPVPGQIRNSNGTLVAGLCREFGAGEITHRHAGDNLEDMLMQLREARVEAHDLILVSGGSGPGTYDFSTELFRQLGATIHFRAVNVRPGKPLIFGTTPTQTVFGLPGNALSHFACFHLFVRQALDRLAARSVSSTQSAVLAAPIEEPHNVRETWWPVSVAVKEGRLECRGLSWQSSGDITRLPAAHGLMKVPASTSQLPAGTMVELLLTRNPFS